MSIILNGTTGITTPDVDAESYTGPLAVNASAPDNSVVVDASGDVGIGTSSPSNTLEVKSPTNDNGIRLSNSAGSYYHLVRSNGDGLLFDADAGNTGGSGADIRFQIKGGEKARITSSGDLLVGRTSVPTVGDATGFGFAFDRTFKTTFFVQDNPTSYACTYFNATSYTSGTAYFAQFRVNGVAVGNITTNGTSTSYATSSDYRLKEDWVAIADASTRVNALKPVNFAWKADGSRVDGFLAHELAEVVPEAVTGTKDATEMVDIKDEDGNVTGQEERPVYQGIDQSKLVPLLTAALQEALAKIDDLTARVSALEAV